MSGEIHFSDDRHSAPELVFHGVTELDLERTCDEDVLHALETWRSRDSHQLAASEYLRMPDCSLFSITYDGGAADYWPNESENDITETLIREFLYPDGICTLSDERVRLYHANYTIIAMDGGEYMLVCPYLTEAGGISGIVVVCVTKRVGEKIIVNS